MKIKKLKRKLDSIYINQNLNKNTLFVFEYVNNNNLTNNKILNKSIICSLSSLNDFLYKYPLSIRKNKTVDAAKNIILIKNKTFFFKNSELFESCFKNFFIKTQNFLYYYLLFSFLLLRRKNC